MALAVNLECIKILLRSSVKTLIFMIRIVYLFLVFTAMNVFAQVPYISQLKGKVTTDFSVLEGVYVINKTTEKVSVTNQDGSFIIRASIGDTLLFSTM